MIKKPKKHALRFRQIHLDFHTHGEIPDIGAKFNKRKFQTALQEGRVNSITLFSKCHHGWSYHPTKVGRMHPHLRRNLLGEQIDACREIGVRCPIYISAGLDEVIAAAHPEWLVKNKEGISYKPLEPAGFKVIRFNSPYLDYLCRQIEEVNALWPDNDGIFLDIIGPRMDYSEESINEMMDLGLDPLCDEDVRKHSALVVKRYFIRATESSLRGNPSRPVFHNSGNIPAGAREWFTYNSHLELESLPTGGWGWDHFPLTASYAQTTGFDYLGMTGKFHISWGEFGGFKRPASLIFECAGMLAMGAKCSVGDQLHPSGEMNADTYRLVGEAYREVEAKEPWCDHVRPVAKIGLVSSDRNQQSIRFFQDANHADEGAARMLLELKLPFVVLDEKAPWTGMELVILPDNVLLTPALVKQANAYLKKGGKILASGASLLNEQRDGFALDAGLQFKGRGAFNVDYLIPTAKLPRVPVRSPLVIHGGAWDAYPRRGTGVIARRLDPYFNRTWRTFCSHAHAPDARLSSFPGATIKGGIAWFAHDIFTRYRHYGQPLYRDYVRDALHLLLPGGFPVETSLPSGGRAALLEQSAEKRFVFHALFGTPAVRGGSRPVPSVPQLEIIEEIIPLRDVSCTVRLPRKIRSARLVPGGSDLPFSQKDGAVSFCIPELKGHQMVELSW